MKPALLLRIASIITLTMALGHSAGGLSSWSPPGETDILSAMRSFHFDAGGLNRSYFDFYIGFGILLAICLFMQAAALWHLASLSTPDALRIRPLIGAFFLASAASTFISWMFIF